MSHPDSPGLVAARGPIGCISALGLLLAIVTSVFPAAEFIVRSFYVQSEQQSLAEQVGVEILGFTTVQRSVRALSPRRRRAVVGSWPTRWPSPWCPPEGPRHRHPAAG